jgi:hypothetical protein
MPKSRWLAAPVGRSSYRVLKVAPPALTYPKPPEKCLLAAS